MSFDGKRKKDNSWEYLFPIKPIGKLSELLLSKINLELKRWTIEKLFELSETVFFKLLIMKVMSSSLIWLLFKFLNPEIFIFKKDGEDYDINVRFNNEDRYDRSLLFNQNIIFRDMSDGQVKEIPVASLIKTKNVETYSAIKHRNLSRVVTLYSSILAGYNAKEIVDQIKFQLDGFDISEDVNFKFTGEIEEQDKNQEFLNTALLMALMLILLLLVFQFNSIVKPLIIILSIFLSFIGVFLGLIIFNMTFVIIMTMLGIISLAGIVVNNSCLLYTSPSPRD